MSVRIIFLFLTSLTIASFGLVEGSVAESSTLGTPEVGFVAIPSLDRDRIATVLESIRERIPLDLDIPLQSYPAQLEEPWKGFPPRLHAEAKSVRLEFAKEEPAGTKATSDTPHFFFHFDFSPDKLTVRTSRSGLYSPAGGVTLTGGERSISRISAVDDDDLRMMIAVAPVGDSHDWGVLLCPREIKRNPEEEEVEENKTTLVGSLYRAIDLKVSVVGDVSATVLSGRTPAYAAAGIKVTSDLPRSLEFFDRVFLKDPKVSLTYSPSVSTANVDPPAETAKAPVINAASGIEVSSTRRTPAGFQQKASLRSVIYINEVYFPPARQFAVGDRENFGNGRCVLLTRTREYEVSYDRVTQ